MKTRLKRQILSFLLAVLFVCGQAGSLSVRALESGINQSEEEYSGESEPGDKSDEGEVQPAGGEVGLSGINLLSSGETLNLDNTSGEMKTAAENSQYYDYDGNKTITILDDAELTVTGSAHDNYILVVDKDTTADITLNNASITVYSNTSAFLLRSGSKVSLILAGENILRSGTNSAGIQVPADAELIISEAEGGGGGSLTAAGGTFGAGIGGANENVCGKVTIKSGTVIAEGGSSAAGIGGGYLADGGTVNIEGGTVAARGSAGGAGIGGGYAGSGGMVEITGGTVTATGGMCAAGIGGGYAASAYGFENKGDGGITIISGGNVRAEGGDSSSEGDDWGADMGCGGTAPVNSGFVTIENSAVLELAKNGVLTKNLSIGECIIKGDGAGTIGGTYSLLTVKGGAAAMAEGSWPEEWITYPDGQIVRDGTEVLLTPGEMANYTFSVWSVNVNDVIVKNNSLTMPPRSITVTAKFVHNNAQAPIIEKQTSRVYASMGEPVTLELTASVTDGGTLSYQWYKSENGSAKGGTAIVGAIYSSYIPDTGVLGDSFYYAIITNTNEQAVNEKTAITVSGIIKLTVSGKTYTLTCEAGTGGRVLSDVGGNYPEGLEISIEAEVLEGYIFTGWSSTGGGVFSDSESLSATFTMPASDTVLKANFTEKVNAIKPEIEIQPKGVEAACGEGVILTVTAAANDAGMLSYQWYKTEESGSLRGEPIEGAVYSSFMPDTRTIGESYYYVTVTNYNEFATGERYASTTSDVVRINVSEKTYTLTTEAEGGRILSDINGKYPEGAKISVEAEALAGYIFAGWSSAGGGAFDDRGSLAAIFTMPDADTVVTANFEKIKNAQIPEIEVQPRGAEVTKGESVTLNVTAAARDGGTLSYQWYKAAVKAAAGGTPIDGATHTSFVPDTQGVGDGYYYVVVTNYNEAVTGEKYASEISDAVRVRVSERTYTLTIETGTGGRILSGSSGKYPEGTEISIEAEALEGYIFTGWSSTGGGTFGDSGSFSTTFTMPASDAVVSASFIYNEGSEVHRAYISGFEDGTFRPDNAVTRAQVAQMLYNLYDTYDTVLYSQSLSDVSQKDWYYDAVMYLAEKGIIQGYTDGTFRPDTEVTRAEFTAMAVRYAGLMEGGTPGFTDVEPDHWAAGYIAAAEGSGLVEGYSGGTFKPGRSMTRAEAVTLLNRMLNREPEDTAFVMPFSDIVTSHWAWANIIEAAVEHPAH